MHRYCNKTDWAPKECLVFTVDVGNSQYISIYVAKHDFETYCYLVNTSVILIGVMVSTIKAAYGSVWFTEDLGKAKFWRMDNLI